MSNYQARRRAIRAERAASDAALCAQQCRSLVYEMERECRRMMDLHREMTSLQFDAKHAHMEAQMRSLQDALVTWQECQPRVYQLATHSETKGGGG